MKPIQVDLIRKLLHANAPQRVARALDKLRPADVAELLAHLSPGETRNIVAILLKARRAAAILVELPEEYLRQVLELLDDATVGVVLSRLAPDDGALFVHRLPEERVAAVMQHVPAAARADIERLLTYPEGTAGSVMTTRFVALTASTPIEAAIDAIRALGDTSEQMNYVYVVDDSQHLVGVVPLRRLITASPDRQLAEVMLKDPASVHALSDQEEAAQLVSKYGLLSIPVVDDQHRVVGVITVDDIIDVINEEATEDMYRLAGLDEEDRVFSTTGQSLKRRLPWNVLNLCTAFLAASVVGAFEETIGQAVVLATFMPIVAGMGGNTGVQTLTVVTRGIALGELQFSSGVRAVVKELGVGVTIGLVMGSLTAVIATLWKGNPMLGVVLVLAMVCNMAIAAFMGAAIPLLLKAVKKDPALGGGIMLTAFTDTFGFLTFLGLASLFITHLT
jgi:magnesium transporter